MGALEIKERLEKCNETRLNGFHITFQNFNGTEQANITGAINDVDQYRISHLRLSTRKRWECLLETADSAARFSNKLYEFLENSAGGDVFITSTPSRFLRKILIGKPNGPEINDGTYV